MNKNESARNYIQFSSCDSLQNRESCRDELYKTSKQRWCDELDVCLHPISGDTFLSICNSTEGRTTWNTIIADPSTFSCWFYTVIRIIQLKNTCKRIHIHTQIQALTRIASVDKSLKKRETLQKKKQDAR